MAHYGPQPMHSPLGCPTLTELTTPVFGSAEELLLGVLRKFFEGKGVHVGTLFSPGLEPPVVMVRRERRSGAVGMRGYDERHLQASIISINTITSGVDADELCEELQEACRLAIRQAQLDQTVIPGAGHISRIESSIMPSRVSDWATSTGVVQYAALPKGWVRYEAIYLLMLRPPDQTAVNNRFI